MFEENILNPMRVLLRVASRTKLNNLASLEKLAIGRSDPARPSELRPQKKKKPGKRSRRLCDYAKAEAKGVERKRTFVFLRELTSRKASQV